MINNKSKFTYTAYLRRVSENNKIKLISISSFQRYPLMGFHSNIATPTVVIEKSIASKKLFNTKFKYGEDIVYWWELSKYSQLRGINIPTSIINVSDESSSNNILNLSEGYANINKTLFEKNFFIKYIHKIYYKINLFLKRFIKILQKKF